MNNDVTGASLLVREKERCIILATATESLPSSTSPPPVFHQIHQDTIHPKALWKSQNTPLPHSHLPTNMITFRVLTLAHNHSFDQSKTVLPALLDLLFFFFPLFMEWFLPAIWALRANSFDNVQWLPCGLPPCYPCTHLETTCWCIGLKYCVWNVWIGGTSCSLSFGIDFNYTLLICVETFSFALRKQQKHIDEKEETLRTPPTAGKLPNNQILCEKWFAVSCIFAFMSCRCLFLTSHHICINSNNLYWSQ